MQNTVVNLPTAQATTLSQGQFSAIPDRSISLEAAKTYGVTQTDGKHIYPYYDINGNHVANKVRPLVAGGMTYEQVAAATPTAAYDAAHGNPERFLRALYSELGGQ